MGFAEYPFLRYLLFFVMGIFMYPDMDLVPVNILCFALVGIWLGYLLILAFGKSIRNWAYYRILLAGLAYLQLILAGSLVAYLQDFITDRNHLIYVEGEVNAYTALVLGQDERKANSIANRVLVKNIKIGENWFPVTGEVLIYHRSETPLLPGQFLLVSGQPTSIPEPANPDEFDYRRFMFNQGVAHRHFIGERFHVLGKVSAFPIESFFIELRIQIMDKIELFFQDKYAKQIAKALLLGQKKEMDRDLSEAYATAGAMHVLAVSGLHVGIIYGFFFLWIKPYRLRTRERAMYLGFVVILIWAYALLTGLSPSVMRAATMFSLVALAQMKSRNPSIFNPIAISALALPLFDPSLIYTVGFQLSYVALLGILLIQPILVGIWIPKNRIIEYAWQISTVGIAAQMATFPLSAYYFHIFPVYFLLSNLVAIPGAFLIMACGLPFMIASQFEFLGKALGWLTEWAIKAVNTLILAIQHLPGARISGLYFQLYDIFLYFLVLGILILIYHFPKRKLVWSMVALLGMVGVYRVFDNVNPEEFPSLTIYKLDKGFALDYRYSGDLWYLDHADSSTLSYNVFPHRDRYGAREIKEIKLFQNEGKQMALLPNQMILTWTGYSWELSGDNNLGLMTYKWENGAWEELNDQPFSNIEDFAKKIVFHHDE
jgi:competence protein ComEC